MTDLANRKCQPIKEGTPPLSDAKAKELLSQVPGWESSGNRLSKTFKFKNYHETMAFVNATAWISHRQDHHPDIELGYNKCAMHYSTHSVGGLSENDFICAAKIERLFEL